jgi:hypothetical protein
MPFGDGVKSEELVVSPRGQSALNRLKGGTMSEPLIPTPSAVTPRPSKTNPQCKVCKSADRFEIEVALACGQSQESVATRFSRDGRTFNRQNIHTHYHKHMQVLDLAVAEEAARRGLSPMLDIQRASEIHAQHEHNRVLIRAQVDATIREGLLLKTRDVLAFMELDVRLEEQRNQHRIDVILIQARVFGEAVRRIMPSDMYDQLIATYDELIAKEQEGQLEDFIYHELPDEDGSGA